MEKITKAKALIRALIAVFSLCGPVLAEGKGGRENERSFFLLGGYQYIKAAALQVGSVELQGIGGYAIILEGGIPLNPKVSLKIGFEGTEVKTQIIDLGNVLDFLQKEAA